MFVKVQPQPGSDKKALHLRTRIQNQNHLGPLHQKFPQDQSHPHREFHIITHTQTYKDSVAHPTLNLVRPPQMEALNITGTF